MASQAAGGRRIRSVVEPLFNLGGAKDHAKAQPRLCDSALLSLYRAVVHGRTAYFRYSASVYQPVTHVLFPSAVHLGLRICHDAEENVRSTLGFELIVATTMRQYSSLTSTSVAATTSDVDRRR